MAMEAYIEGSEAIDMLCEDPFDSIDDLLDLQNDDDFVAMVDACGNGGSMPPLRAPAMISSAICGGMSVGNIAGEIHGRPAAVAGGWITSEDDALGMCNDIDIINPEWLSNFLEVSELNLDIPTITSFDDSQVFQSQNPISLPSTSSSSSSSTSITPPMDTISPAQTRTKRPRPKPFSASMTRLDEPESVFESFPALMKKNKVVVNEKTSMLVRKCMHCQIQKTPQWRAGPMGPKTLCNACGVRYKSGRLFPEYRPAASPTFAPAIHSNSHKKVVEMRLRSSQRSAAKNCDLLEYIRIRE